MKRLCPLLAILAVTGCTATQAPPQALTPQLLPDTNHPNRHVNGPIGGPSPLPQPALSYAEPTTLSMPGSPGATGGDVSLDFADTDIREVVAQILGSILKVNYTIAPAVHGTATLHTVTPLARSQLLPTLQALLAEDEATLVETGGLYRVVPSATSARAGGAATAGLATGSYTAGAKLVPLHYASAVDLAKVLQPYAGQGASIAVDPGSNALVISGTPESRDAMVALAQAFDTNLLAGQSYALLPAPQGSAADFATALESAFRTHGGGLTNVVRVVPMERVGSVLIIASQPAYIDAARRVYDLIEQRQRETLRSWHVYYLQDSKAEDTAYLLQEAFTPDNVTATPSSRSSSQTAAGSATSGASTGGLGSGTNMTMNSSSLGSTSNTGIGTAIGSGGIADGTAAAGSGSTTTDAAGSAPAQTPANPLLGGLNSGSGNGGGATEANTLRIIPDPQNNSVLIYATQDEDDRITAMLRKVDIVPLQVRIDATIAEVTLNNQLKYGTQFFFRSGGINGILNNTDVPTPLGATPASTVLSTSFPGFILSGNGAGGAPIALQALQAVTTVRVLSSPELMVTNNQTAHLQVGQLVPYLTSSSQSTITTNSAVINSINYQPTGVIMNVTPHVNDSGLVTMDISQQVSAVDTSVSTATTGISSPTFSEQAVSSRVTVQDGQTVGLAGLITDNLSKSNSGIPFLKDIPLIGLLAGTQNNTRNRVELLILITPHVQYNDRDARALTADLQQQLHDAAAVPGLLNGLQSPGSDDPNAVVRSRLHLGQ